MSAIIVLILRLLLVISLYAFLSWAIYTIWYELRVNTQILNSRQAPTITLSPMDNNEVGVHKFSQLEIIIGRDQSCEYHLQHETISARHARLSYHHKQWWVEDLLSKNGSYLNDERLETPTVMMSGDKLRCGSINIIIDLKPDT